MEEDAGPKREGSPPLSAEPSQQPAVMQHALLFTHSCRRPEVCSDRCRGGCPLDFSQAEGSSLEACCGAPVGVRLVKQVNSSGAWQMVSFPPGRPCPLSCRVVVIPANQRDTYASQTFPAQPELVDDHGKLLLTGPGVHANGSGIRPIPLQHDGSALLDGFTLGASKEPLALFIQLVVPRQGGVVDVFKMSSLISEPFTVSMRNVPSAMLVEASASAPGSRVLHRAHSSTEPRSPSLSGSRDAPAFERTSSGSERGSGAANRNRVRAAPPKARRSSSSSSHAAKGGRVRRSSGMASQTGIASPSASASPHLAAEHAAATMSSPSGLRSVHSAPLGQLQQLQLMALSMSQPGLPGQGSGHGPSNTHMPLMNIGHQPIMEDDGSAAAYMDTDCMDDDSMYSRLSNLSQQPWNNSRAPSIVSSGNNSRQLSVLDMSRQGSLAFGAGGKRGSLFGSGGSSSGHMGLLSGGVHVFDGSNSVQQQQQFSRNSTASLHLSGDNLNGSSGMGGYGMSSHTNMMPPPHYTPLQSSQHRISFGTGTGLAGCPLPGLPQLGQHAGLTGADVSWEGAMIDAADAMITEELMRGFYGK